MVCIGDGGEASCSPSGEAEARAPVVAVVSRQIETLLLSQQPLGEALAGVDRCYQLSLIGLHVEVSVRRL